MVHKLNNHKKANHLVSAYSRARWMSTVVFKEIKKVVQSYGVCQKFAKLVSRPKVKLPILSKFNDLVTLDLKVFALKYIL